MQMKIFISTLHLWVKLTVGVILVIMGILERTDNQRKCGTGLLVINSCLLYFRSFWLSTLVLWSFICCSTSGFPSSMRPNMTLPPANTGSYSKSVTLKKRIKNLWALRRSVIYLCSSQSRLHVSLFPLREEAPGDAVRASLLSRNNAVTQHLQGLRLCSYSTSHLSRMSSISAQITVPFQNCSFYWGFAAWMAYYINHPLYTPPSERAHTHKHTHI